MVSGHLRAFRYTSQMNFACRIVLRIVASLGVAFLSIVVGFLPGVAAAAETKSAPVTIPSDVQQIPRGELRSQATIPKGAEVVYYGIEPTQTYAISLEDGTFNMNFYLWFRWKGPYDPTQTTTFDNSSNAMTNHIQNYSYTNAQGNSEPITVADGYKYQLVYIQSGFAGLFDLARYPLDTQKLQLRFESTTYAADQLVYVPDPKRSADQTLVVPDWTTRDIEYHSYIKHYTTNFGNSDWNGPGQDWSLGTWSISIVRPISHFYAKLLLPVVLVMVASVLGLLLRSHHEISRLALSSTGLLTLVFLQLGYSSDLPKSAPLVLMDEIYALAFTVVIISFIRMIWETTQVFHFKRDADNFLKVDRLLAGFLGVTFIVGTALLIIL